MEITWSRKLPGVALITLKWHRDERGAFFEAYQSEKLAAQGLPDFTPRQLSVSVSKAGVVRGIHAEPWSKYINVISGAAAAVIAEVRPDNPNFGTHEGYMLNPRRALFVPRGYGNSFQSLKANTIYSYLFPDVWKPEDAKEGKYLGIAYNDPDLAISWPITPVIVSEKDAHNPTLRLLFPDAPLFSGRTTIIPT